MSETSKDRKKGIKSRTTMKNLLIMQENEFSGTISIYPSTMQLLCRPTHVGKLVTSNFQICFPAHILVYMLNIATAEHAPRPN